MSGSNSEPNKGDNGALVPLAHQEVRYRAAPTWTRALQWAIVGCIGFGFLYAVVARIDEVVIARGELKAWEPSDPSKLLFQESLVVSLSLRVSSSPQARY